jgi:iron complex transport system permease protein
VNSGAGLAAAVCCAFFPGAYAALPFAAFLGALLSVLLVLLIAERTGASKITLVLGGVAISSVLAAGVDAVVTFVPDALAGYSDFRIGSLAGLTMSKLAPAAWVVLAALALAFSLTHELDLLMLGRDTARSLGLRAGRMRILLLAVAAALAGAAVSFAGLLGFVGLIVPHIMRRLVGDESRLLLPGCAMGGAVMLLLCDLASRMLFRPYELPVGITLSFIGGPFFIWLLLRQRKGRTHD